MATVNKRVFQPQALTINAIAAGGLTQYTIDAGYDDELQNPVDGAQLAFIDYLTERVRGDFSSEDWVHFIELLTGTVGTSVFYQRKSGAAEATGYIKHALKNPVIYQSVLNLLHRKYGNIAGTYECRAADETEGIADLWEMTDSQTAPTHLSTDRGLEITALQHGVVDIYHTTALQLTIILPLFKASHDGDIGYTAVDALTTGMRVYGSIKIQDVGITSAQVTAAALIAAARASLVASVKQAQGASAKTLTIAGVKFKNMSVTTNAPVYGSEITADEYTVNFEVSNNTATPLTLAGANKIVTIS